MTETMEITKQSGLLSYKVYPTPNPLEVSTDHNQSIGKIEVYAFSNQERDVQFSAFQLFVQLGVGENDLSADDLSDVNAVVQNSSEWKAHYEFSGNQGMLYFRPNGDKPYLLSKGKSLTFKINGFPVNRVPGSTAIKLIETSAFNGERPTPKVTEFQLWKAPYQQFYLKNFRAVVPGTTDPKPLASVRRNSSFELQWEASDVECDITYGENESVPKEEIKKNGSAYSCAIKRLSRATTFILKAKDKHSKLVSYASCTLQVTDPSFQMATYGLVPPGTIMPYYSHSIDLDFENGLGKKDGIYEGWALCDGRNGTPDLRERFIMGTEIASVGQFGDADQHDHELKIKTGEIKIRKGGEHDHKVPQTWYDTHVKGDGNVTVIDRNSKETINCKVTWHSGHTHVLEAATLKSESSEGQNRPKWYGLAYIMKLHEKYLSYLKNLGLKNNVSLSPPQSFSKDDIFALYPTGQQDFSNIARLKTIEVKCGNVVDCIKLEWEDTEGNLVRAETFAGKESGGAPVRIELDQKEYVTEISGQFRTLWGKPYLAHLEIRTNKDNNYGPYGYNGESPFTETFNHTDKQLLSLVAFPGKFVTQLGFITRSSDSE